MSSAEPSASVPPQPVLDYGPPARRPLIGLTVAYGLGAFLFGAGTGLAFCGLLASLGNHSYNGVPPFAAVGGLGVCLLLWGLFTLALVLYLRFAPR